MLDTLNLVPPVVLLYFFCTPSLSVLAFAHPPTLAKSRVADRMGLVRRIPSRNNLPEGPRELSPGFRLQPGLCVDFKAGLRKLGARGREKSAVKLRDF